MAFNGIVLIGTTLNLETVEETAALIQPVHEELIRQAAQGEVLHNDDTSMRVLEMEREPSDERTGVFTSGIVSIASGVKIALYFTGRQHAGENLAGTCSNTAGWRRNWRRRRPSRTRPPRAPTERSMPAASDWITLAEAQAILREANVHFTTGTIAGWARPTGGLTSVR